MTSRRQFSRHRLAGPFRLALFGMALLAGAGAAMAQSAVCRQIEAELSSAGRGNGAQAGRYSREAQAARGRLGRIQGTMASIGCNRGGFLFGPQPPAECSGLRAQAAALQGSIAQLEGASRQASGGDPARRAQLLAALDANNCRGGPPRPPQVVAAQPPRPRGFFDVLFGRNEPQQSAYATETIPGGVIIDPDAEKKKDEANKKPALGGSLPVCVRTCDGFFFPVNYQGANDEHEDVCTASCPAATTQLYWMQAGADLDTAVTEDGRRYSAAPYAFQYRQSYDPSCSCKAPGQNWANTLRQADALVRDRRTDITVTQESSDQMARPKPVRELRGVRGQQARAPEVPEPAPNTNFATNGTATAGIGPAAANGRVLGTGDGETREINGRDGEKKNIRVLVP